MLRPSRAFIAAIVLIVLGLVSATRGPEPSPGPSPRDTDLFQNVIDRVRGGESYYVADAEAMRAAGYPTASVFNWRLPTLTLVQSELPSSTWSVFILCALGLVSFVLWFRHLSWQGVRAVAAVPFLLMTLPVWALIRASSSLLHDLWAGQLIALSLACWASDAIGLSLAAALAAASIRELALPYLLVMTAMAVIERKRAEAMAWLAVLVLFLAFLTWHVAQARPLVATDSPYYGWVSFGGWRFALKTMRVNVLLMLLPAWLIAVVVPLAWAGLLSWATPEGRRVAATVTIYLAAFTVVGRSDNWYWGLIVAPLLPLGAVGWLVHVHASLRSGRTGRDRHSGGNPGASG